MYNVNNKGTFYLSKLCLYHMKMNRFGHIIMHSPPLPSPNDISIYNKKTAYMISKYGMTMNAMGLAVENKGYNIADLIQYGLIQQLKVPQQKITN